MMASAAVFVDLSSLRRDCKGVAGGPRSRGACAVSSHSRDGRLLETNGEAPPRLLIVLHGLAFTSSELLQFNKMNEH